MRVRATDLEDVATACDGARRASAFLSRDGLASDHVIEVELLAQLPAHEYMAYVAMFGTMRRSIRWSMDSTRCASGPVPGRTSTSWPMADGRAYFQRIVAGRALRDEVTLAD